MPAHPQPTLSTHCTSTHLSPCTLHLTLAKHSAAACSQQSPCLSAVPLGNGTLKTTRLHAKNRCVRAFWECSACVRSCSGTAWGVCLELWPALLLAAGHSLGLAMDGEQLPWQVGAVSADASAPVYVPHSHTVATVRCMCMPVPPPRARPSRHDVVGVCGGVFVPCVPGTQVGPCVQREARRVRREEAGYIGNSGK